MTEKASNTVNEGDRDFAEQAIIPFRVKYIFAASLGDEIRLDKELYMAC